VKRKNILWIFIASFLSMYFLSLRAEAKTPYVELPISNDCEDYNPEIRTCGSGQDIAYNSLAEGMNKAVVGDTVVLRSGEYTQLRPLTTGISIKAYPDEIPIILLCLALLPSGLSIHHISQ